MAISTFSELKSAVEGWLAHGNTSTIAKIPDFIALAEVRLSADLEVQPLELEQDATITAGVAPLPEDALEVRGLRIDGATFPDVEVTSRERIQYLRSAGYTTDRTYGAIVGRTVEVYPNTTGTLKVLAKCRMPALSDAAPTNWLLTTFPNAYLYGALVEGADWLEDEAAMARWATRYAEAVRQVNGAFGYAGSMGAAKVHGVR